MIVLQEPDSDIQDGSDGNVVEDEDNYGGGHAVPASGFKAIKHQQPALATTQRDARTVQKLLQEYNSLEYEDIVAGLPTKFHYRQVGNEDQESAKRAAQHDLLCHWMLIRFKLCTNHILKQSFAVSELF